MTKPVFDPRFYRQHNKLRPIWRGGLAQAHYQVIGRRRGYQPSALFDPVWFARRARDLGLGPVVSGQELDSYIEDHRLWTVDPHPFAFFRFETFASADPTANPLETARETLARDAPLGMGHPLIDLGAWAESGADPSIDGRASAEAAMRSIAVGVAAALRRGRDITSPVVPDVLFINGEAHCPACTQYRVWAPARALQAAGLKVAVANADDLPRLEGVAPRARVVMVFRAQMTHTLRRFLDRARHLGARIGFDCDDLLFGKPLQVGLQVDTYGYREVAGANRHAAQVTEAVQAADFAIVPTETLAAVLEDIGLSHDRIAVVPSFLSPRQVAAADAVDPAARGGIVPALCAASGTWTHHEDFEAAVRPIADTLGARPDLTLTMIGAVMPDAFPDLARVSHQLVHDDRILRDWSAYVERYGAFRANLVPLDLDNGFCQAKSEVKYIEAGLVGTPSVGSATEAYQRALSRGGGLLARSDDDWRSAIARLTEDPVAAERMGAAARADVIVRYGPSGTFAALYVDEIRRQIEGAAAATGGRERHGRYPALPVEADEWVEIAETGAAVTTSGNGARTAATWRRRLAIDGEFPEAETYVLTSPAAADDWVASGAPGTAVACGPELARAIRSTSRQVLTGIPWVDPRLYYRSVRQRGRTMVVIDTGRLGMPEAPIELADRLTEAIARQSGDGHDILLITRAPVGVNAPGVLVWQWPGSPVELASLLRLATAAERIDPLWWDPATTALDMVVGLPLGAAGSALD